MTRLGYAFLLGTVALSGNNLNGQTPTQMVEPSAGSWRTWIITSGRELQVTPPDRAGIAGELTWLREFMRSANDQARAQMLRTINLQAADERSLPDRSSVHS